MGRSVMTLSGAEVVAYNRFEPSHYCETCEDFCEEHQDELFCESYCDHSEEFTDFLEWVKEYAQELFPSMDETDEWEDREVHIVMKNAHSVIGVSEYCGVVSISLGANYDRQGYWADDSELANLGAHWRRQVEKKFLSAFGEMTLIGRFSNGEAVFEKVA